MKQSEILQEALSGRLVSVVEWRDWEVREPKNGVVISTQFLLMGRETVAVQHFESKGTKLTDVARPSTKPGTKVVFVATSLEQTRFGTRARGIIRPYEG
jgi:hypothetical protein